MINHDVRLTILREIRWRQYELDNIKESPTIWFITERYKKAIKIIYERRVRVMDIRIEFKNQNIYNFITVKYKIWCSWVLVVAWVTCLITIVLFLF